MKVIANILDKINVPRFYIFDAFFFLVYTIILYIISGSAGSFVYGYTCIIFYLFYSFFNGWTNLSIEKLIKEYNLQGYYQSIKKVLSLSKKLLFRFSIICFVLMILIGVVVSNINSFNIMNLVFVSGLSLFLLPFICVYRGYLTAKKFDKNVINSYLVTYFTIIVCSIFKVSTFSIFIGNLFGLIYLLFSIYINREKLEKKTLKVKEKIVSDKEIITVLKKSLLPYTTIQLMIILIYFIDVFVLNLLLVNNGYSLIDINSIMSVVLFGGVAINIVISILILGFFNKINDTESMINKDLLVLLLTVIPISILLSFLAKPIWILLYSNSIIEIKVYQFYAISIIFVTLFIWSILVLYRLKEYKKIGFYLVLSLMFNLILKVPLSYGLGYMGFPLYYGSITSIMTSFLITSFMILKYIGKKKNINYENIINKILNMLIVLVIFTISLMVIKVVVPFNSSSRFISLLYILFFGFISFMIYRFIVVKSKLLSKK